jgi:asparagine synthase (glutamine-hydrolysing)
MPGLAGVISRRTIPECDAIVSAMVGSMEHESFYLSGMYSAKKLGVYCGWVTQDKSFAASNVFLNEQKDVALIFSGECFVDNEIRDGLKEKGHQLEKTNGDWLVHLYEEKGDQFFEKLNGLFSGLLIDQRKKNAILFNDRYGIERIYYYEAQGNFYFASEAKALLRILPKLRAFDDEGVAQFLAFGCTLDSRTLFRGVQLLPSASAWSFKDGKCYKRKYFSPQKWEAQSLLSIEAYESEFQETFQRVLPRYTDEQAEIGISLTGGLDTRMIMACLPSMNRSYTCYTFAGEKGLTLDARLAANVAASLGLAHQVFRLGTDFLRHFETYLDRTVYITDGCAGATSSHEIYFNAQARQVSPVRLTGNFGSEVLRSVSTFNPLGLQPELLSDECAKAVAAETQSITASAFHPVTLAAFHEIPSSLFGLLAAGQSQVTFRTPYLDNELVALAYRAPVAVRRSALQALQFIEQANPQLARIPTDRGELLGCSGLGRIQRRILGEVTFKLDYYNSEGLPRRLSLLDSALRTLSSSLRVLGAHKYLTYRHWFRKELAPLVIERLSSRRVWEAPWWAKDAPEMVAQAHIAGRGNYQRELNVILTLEAVDRLLFSEVRAEKPEQRERVIEVAA